MQAGCRLGIRLAFERSFADGEVVMNETESKPGVANRVKNPAAVKLGRLGGLKARNQREAINKRWRDWRENKAKANVDAG